MVLGGDDPEPLKKLHEIQCHFQAEVLVLWERLSSREQNAELRQLMFVSFFFDQTGRPLLAGKLRRPASGLTPLPNLNLDPKPLN